MGEGRERGKRQREETYELDGGKEPRGKRQRDGDQGGWTEGRNRGGKWMRDRGERQSERKR